MDTYNIQVMNQQFCTSKDILGLESIPQILLEYTYILGRFETTAR